MMPFSSFSSGKVLSILVDSGRYIGAKNVLKPLGVWARRMDIEESVAEENHLKPLMLQGPSGVLDCDCGDSSEGEYVAIVSVPETSLPPLRSVIHCPLVHAYLGSRDVRRSYAFWSTLLSAGSRYWDERWVLRSLAAPSVMALGQVTLAHEPVHR